MGLDMYLSGRNSDNTLTEVAYWRKANAIHRWFVENVQDGIDECQESPVTRQQLNELLSVCHEVIKAITLIDGHVFNGRHKGPDTNGEWVDDYRDGKVIAEPEVIEKILPTQNGFFFGHTGYNDNYFDQVKSTVDQLQKVLTLEYKEFVYQSSW